VPDDETEAEHVDAGANPLDGLDFEGAEAEMRRVVEEASWRDLLVWDDDDELDFDASVEWLARHDVTTAKYIAHQHEGEVLALLDGVEKPAFRIWDGVLWRDDTQCTIVSGWMTGYWNDLKRALRYLDGEIASQAKQKKREMIESGASDADAEKAATALLKSGRARLKDANLYFEKLGNNPQRRGVQKEMMNVTGIQTRDADYDANPAVCTFRNGVVDFSLAALVAEGFRRTGSEVSREKVADAISMTAHEPRHRATIWASDTEWDPDARAPVFEKYLEETLPDPEVRSYLQRVLGSGLLGDPRAKVMLNLIGPTNTGKTVLLDVLNSVLGDFATFADSGLFLKNGSSGKSAEGPSPSLHALRKAKFVVSSEPDSESRWNGGLLKSLTGHDQIVSRGMWGKYPIAWHPRFLMVVASNAWVKTDTSDEALMRRIAPVHFAVQRRAPGPGERWEDIPEDQRIDKSLTERIIASQQERSGVINWLVRGLIEYLVMDGIGEPPGVAAHREVMKKSLSTVAEFVGDLTEHGYLVKDAAGVPKSRTVGVKELYQAYLTWCTLNDVERPRGQRHFKGDLVANFTTGGETSKGGGKRGHVFDRLSWWCSEDWYGPGGDPKSDPYTALMASGGGT
jgi:putative DNA primase/helicase